MLLRHKKQKKMKIFNYIYDDGPGRRLDVFLAENCDVTRSYAANIIEGGNESGKSTISAFIKFIFYIKNEL